MLQPIHPSHLITSDWHLQNSPLTHSVSGQGCEQVLCVKSPRGGKWGRTGYQWMRQLWGASVTKGSSYASMPPYACPPMLSAPCLGGPGCNYVCTFHIWCPSSGACKACCQRDAYNSPRDVDESSNLEPYQHVRSC